MNVLGIVALISALIAGSGSHWVTRKYFEAEKYWELRQVQIALEHQKEKTRGIEEKLLTEQSRERVKYKEVIKYVNQYIPSVQAKQSQCNLTYGALSLFNRTTHQPNAAASSVRKRTTPATKD